MQVSLDPQLVRAFVTVAEVGSFTRAARLLALTQSATSLQVQRLEELLEAELLVRSPRGAQLTAAGEAFMVYARRMLALQDEAVRSVRQVPETDRIRVGMPDVYAMRYLPDVLSQFAQRHPDVHPEVRCEVSTRLFDAFDDGALDLCLGVRHERVAAGAVLGEDDIAWVSGPGLSLGPKDAVPLALYPDYCIFRARGLRALADAGRSWRLAYTSESSSAIDIAVTEGFAVAIKSRRTIRPEWRELGDKEGMPPLSPVEIELRRSPATESPAHRALADLLETRVRDDLARPPSSQDRPSSSD